jgi:hypothetical protein
MIVAMPNRQYPDGHYMCAVCCVPDPKFMAMAGALVCSISCEIRLREVLRGARKTKVKS